jgi:hypothetical protein
MDLTFFVFITLFDSFIIGFTNAMYHRPLEGMEVFYEKNTYLEMLINYFFNLLMIA